ncbi:MAG TPA: response regulator [Nitrospinota bacterium]|nr:response regulator [Nitrospinota bacterium]
MEKTKKILFVDKEKNVCKVMEDSLNLFGFNAISRRDSQEALSLLEKEDFSLVITNGGIGMLEEIKSKKPDLPVCVIVEYSSPTIAKKILNAGADSYMVKPFSITEVKQTIEKLLKIA